MLDAAMLIRNIADPRNWAINEFEFASAPSLKYEAGPATNQIKELAQPERLGLLLYGACVNTL